MLQILTRPVVSQVRRENRAKNKFTQRHEHLAIFKKELKCFSDSKSAFHRQFPQLYNSSLNSLENFSFDKT